MIENDGKSSTIDLRGLDDKWSKISHETCCDCGADLSEECPLRLWRGEGSDTEEIALCGNCSLQRITPVWRTH